MAISSMIVHIRYGTIFAIKSWLSDVTCLWSLTNISSLIQRYLAVKGQSWANKRREDPLLMSLFATAAFPWENSGEWASQYAQQTSQLVRGLLVFTGQQPKHLTPTENLVAKAKKNFVLRCF